MPELKFYSAIITASRRHPLGFWALSALICLSILVIVACRVDCVGLYVLGGAILMLFAALVVAGIIYAFRSSAEPRSTNRKLKRKNRRS